MSKHLTLIVLALMGLMVISGSAFSQGWNVELVGTLNLPGWSVKGVVQQSNYAYLAARTAGLQIVDVALPANMVIVGSLTGIGTISEVMLANDHTYLYASPNSLKIVNVSDPTDPILAGSYPLNGAIRAIDEERDLAFSCGCDGQIRILDISAPANPVEISSYGAAGGGSLIDLDAEGDYLYAVCWYGGSAGEDWVGDSLLVLDVSDPENPCFIGWSNLAGMSIDIVVSNGYLYVVGYAVRFRIIDVSVPVNPFETSRLQFAGFPEGVTVGGDFAYVTGSDTGGGIRLRIIDCTDPFNPLQSGYYHTPNVAWDVAVDSNLAYVAESGSFEIYDCSAALAFDVEITLVPMTLPVTIPAGGGSFEFYVLAANNGPAVLTVDLWSEVILPNGIIQGPLLGPAGTSLNPATTGWYRYQNVPGYAPAGVYTYVACAGDYPETVCASDSLQFTKLVTGDGDWVDDWNNWGEPMNGAEAVVSMMAPDEFTLCGTYPNPFNPSTTISFVLPEATKVHLSIYDVSGRLVTDLVDGWRDAGYHEVTFDGKGLTSGVYLYILSAGEFHANGKLVYMK